MHLKNVHLIGWRSLPARVSHPASTPALIPATEQTIWSPVRWSEHKKRCSRGLWALYLRRPAFPVLQGAPSQAMGADAPLFLTVPGFAGKNPPVERSPGRRWCWEPMRGFVCGLRSVLGSCSWVGEPTGTFFWVGGGLGTSLPCAEGEFKHTSQFLAGHYQWSMRGPSLGVVIPLDEISHGHSSPSETIIWDAQWVSFFFLFLML